MKISEILAQNAQGVSFEFFPPKTEGGMKALMLAVKALKKYNPLYVSMTCGAAGSTQQRTKEATYLLLGLKQLTVMPHLTSIDATKASIEGLIDEYKQKGIENIMALRGDPPEGVSGFDFSKQDFVHASELVAFIRRFGRFCIGVAVYPEGHIESKTVNEDIEYTKRKIDAGAEFAVTQMFFDNIYYYKLLERMKKKGIAIPVLPGIFPLTDICKLKKFCSVCRTTIPKNIERAMAQLTDAPEEMYKVGLDFTITQCRDLIAHGYKRLHFFTFNKVETMTTILNALPALARPLR
jgi:methylenetetrahydrofolate reductase (NADPH)